VEDPTKFFGLQNKEPPKDPVIYLQSFNTKESSVLKNEKENPRHEMQKK
jgi:hypothetical protein